MMFTTKCAIQNIRNVAIVGSGLMGSGIAQVSASSGLNVVLSDVKQDSLDKAMKSINKSLTRIAKKQNGSDKVEKID